MKVEGCWGGYGEVAADPMPSPGEDPCLVCRSDRSQPERVNSKQQLEEAAERKGRSCD